MKNQDFTTTISVDQSPEEVFEAITNVRGWWSREIEGDTGMLGAEFTYRYKDVHRSKQKATEIVPGQKVVWHVFESELRFAKDKSEWKKTAKRKSVSRTKAWHPGLNATVVVQTPGER